MLCNFNFKFVPEITFTPANNCVNNRLILYNYRQKKRRESILIFTSAIFAF